MPSTTSEPCFATWLVAAVLFVTHALLDRAGCITFKAASTAHHDTPSSHTFTHQLPSPLHQYSYSQTSTLKHTNMRFQTLSMVSAVLAVVAAQKVEQSDIPSQCNNVCADLVSTALRCDRDNSKR
jgi:hypothetical protein